MKWFRSSFWKWICFPPIGARLTYRRDLGSRHIPFLAWFRYFVLSWLTVRAVAVGIIAFAPTVGLFLIGFESETARLGFALMALFVVVVVMGILFLPRIRIQADVPRRIECGKSFALRYTLHNRSHRDACDIGVETLSFPNPFQIKLKSAHLPALPAGETAHVESHGKARRRGRYQLPPLRWDTDFPFGLWRWGHTDWQERHLIVYPSYEPLESIDIPLGVRNRMDTEPARQLTRAAIEFHGCREFRQGDSIRHVHPRSSARLGEPVVKKFQAEGHGRTAILVDTRCQWPLPFLRRMRDPVIEGALSLAASIVECLARGDRVLELLVAGPGVFRFVSAGKYGFFEDVLDILSSVEPESKDPIPELGPILIDEICEIQSVCLILTRWDRVRADLVRDLSDQDVGVKVLLVERRSTDNVAKLPPGITSISCRAIARGEVAAL